MGTPKESLMAATLSLTTAFAVVSTVLHFTPWPHNQNNSPTVIIAAPQDIIELTYTVEELKMLKFPPRIHFTGDTFPKYVHLSNELQNSLYPIKWINPPNGSADLIWGIFEYEPKQTLQISLFKNQ